MAPLEYEDDAFTSGGTDVIPIEAGRWHWFKDNIQIQLQIQLLQILQIQQLMILIGDACFPEGTLVTMADGSKKKIEDIAIGERVRGVYRDNLVVALYRPKAGGRRMVRFQDNSGAEVVTDTMHPFMTPAGWACVSPSDYHALACGKDYPCIGPDGPVSVRYDGVKDMAPLPQGGSILTEDGSAAVTFKLLSYDSQEIIYSLVCDGDHSIYTNGFATAAWPEDDFDYADARRRCGLDGGGGPRFRLQGGVAGTQPAHQPEGL